MPQDGSVTEAPNPRYDRPASESTATAIDHDSCTMNTGATFGSRWRSRFCAGVRPAARPASTKSLCCTRRSSGRVTRAMFTPNPMPTAQMTTHSDPPQTEEIIMAMMSTGNAMKMSTSTATTSRIQRNVRAPSAASAMPTIVATTPAPTLTKTVVRAPAMMRLRMSRPVPSVPSRCGQLGAAQRLRTSASRGLNGVQNRATSATAAITATAMSPKRPVELAQRRRSQRGIMPPSDAGRRNGARDRR